MTRSILTSPTSNAKAIAFFPNLDGLRFFCFLSVFLFHSFHTEYDYIKSSEIYTFFKGFLFKNGNLGVNFFFVLSGFLITYLLLKEKEACGKIDIGNFWKRRALRIWPLFYACLLFGFVAFPFIKQLSGQVPNETANIIYYVVFLNNFDFIKNGLPDSSVLGVLWSVAIEEQFYLMWPLLLVMIPATRYKYLFAAIITGTLIFRAYFDNPIYNEFHTLSCIGDMTVGAFGALLIHTTSLTERLRTIPKAYIAILYVIVSAVFLFRDSLQSATFIIRVFERIFIAALFLMVILEQNYAKNSLFKLGNYKMLSKLGTITYGLYCLHFVGILITTNTFKVLGWNTSLWQVLILETLVALLITIAIAKLSYRYLEMPFLKLKYRLSYISTSKA